MTNRDVDTAGTAVNGKTKRIADHLDKAKKCRAEAKQHRHSAEQLIMRAAEALDVEGFAVLRQKSFTQIRRSRAAELMAIAIGKKTFDEVREATRKRVARHHARATDASVTAPDVTDSDNRPARLCNVVRFDPFAEFSEMEPADIAAKIFKVVGPAKSKLITEQLQALVKLKTLNLTKTTDPVSGRHVYAQSERNRFRHQNRKGGDALVATEGTRQILTANFGGPNGQYLQSEEV